MGEIEDRERDLPAGRVYVAQRRQRLLRPLGLGFELVRLGLVYRFFDRAPEVRVQEAVLHGCQFGLPLGKGRGLPPPVRRQVGDRVAQAAAEPRRQLWREAHLAKIVDDRLLELVRLPTDRRMVRAGVVICAPIIDVLIDPAPFELAADTFPGDRLAAVSATEQAARQGMVGSARASVSTVQNILAGVERGPIDQALVASLEDLPISLQFANVEAIVQNVREGRSVKPRLTLAEDMAFSFQHVGQSLERVPARGIEIENANQRLRLLGMRLNRLILVVNVNVAKRSEARGQENCKVTRG